MDFTDEQEVEETLVEMAYRWGDIERTLPTWFRKKGEDRDQVGTRLAEAIKAAFRVEAIVHEEWNTLDNTPYQEFRYTFLFDVGDRAGRDGAQVVRDETKFLLNVIQKLSGGARRGVVVRVTSVGAPAAGEICERPSEPRPKPHIDVTEVPTAKPDSNVPLIEKDGYWLTPIEVPFYDALRETGAIFAVQPWVQGVESRYRPDFMIFYDGGTAIVELDGHDSHKTREQRTRDARRQRWFEGRGIRVLRWTGSEIHANAQDCVRDLLDILRGTRAKF